MEKKHTETIMQALETAYPQFYVRKTDEERRCALRLWHEMFAEDDGLTVGAAVKAFIATDTKGFPPAIGQIKDRIVKLKHPDLLDEAQAWDLVSRAIANSTYHAAEVFAKLPPVVQKVVGSPTMLRTWAASPREELQTVIASNFQRAFRARAQEAKEYLALPGDIRALLDNAVPTRTLPELPDPERQKQAALQQLSASRETEARRILGDAYDEIYDSRHAARAE